MAGIQLRVRGGLKALAGELTGAILKALPPAGRCCLRRGVPCDAFPRVRLFSAVLLLLAMGWGLFVPGEALAQPIRSLEQKIETLERKLAEFEELKEELEALKKQLRAIQSEQKAQKARVEKQEKALGPLQELKRTVKELSKVEISGGITGILQSTAGVERRLGGDDSFAVGSFDLIFGYKPLDNVAFVLDLEGVGGDGPDATVPSFAGLNDDAGSTEDEVTVLEAYGEATFLDRRLTLTGGKIDLTNYVDGNAIANDETSQFLSSAFVNNNVLSAPDNAPGLRARYDIVPGMVYWVAGAMSRDKDANDRTTDHIFDHVYAVSEVGITPKIMGLQGNYRVWGFLDGAGQESRRSGNKNFTATGSGLSFDQELAGWLGAFFRIGVRDGRNLNYDTRTAWSAGLQISQIIPNRKDDVLGLAYGQIRPIKRAGAGAGTGTRFEDERLAEAYYRFHLAEDFHISALLQHMQNRQGAHGANDLWVYGLRLQVNF